jgi:hypothetical protein
MSLKALMQKFSSPGSATATPATFATKKRSTAETVATVAAVAVAAAEGRETAALRNRHYQPSVDPDHFLSQAASPGVAHYCKVHDDNLVGATPYAQIAIEYEIEMLPLRFGEAFIAACVELLGSDILPCLSFVTSHIELDVKGGPVALTGCIAYSRSAHRIEACASNKGAQAWAFKLLWMEAATRATSLTLLISRRSQRLKSASRP